jgi:ABC-type transport system substrate-binding protein
MQEGLRSIRISFLKALDCFGTELFNTQILHNQAWSGDSFMLKVLTGTRLLKVWMAGALLIAFAAACGGTETVEVVKEVKGDTVTVEVIKEVKGDTVTVEVIKEVPVTVVAVATPTAGVEAPIVPRGRLVAAISNVYFMNASPRYCPACSVQARTGAVEFLLQAVRDESGGIGIAPMLAEEWTQSSDGLSYTDFKIREGVTFHDGYGEMTAEDVAFSWNDANPNIVPDAVHDTGGAIGTILERVEVLDEHNVRFHWKQFNASILLKYVTNFEEGIGILSKNFFDEVGDEGMRERLIGTGPLQMDRWTQHEGAFLTAVPDHWRKTSYVEAVSILEVPEGSTRKAMLVTGQAQIVGDLPLKDWSGLTEDGYMIAPERKLGDQAFTMAGNYWETELSDGTVFTASEPGELLYKPALEDKPWIGDPSNPAKHESAKKVRQAMAMAIDREALVNVLSGGFGVVSYMPGIQTSDPLHKSEWEIPYDPDGARALLAEAGYADGFDLEWWGGPAVATDDTIHEAIAAMWLKELNISSTIDQQNYSSFRPTLVNRTNTKLLFSGGDAHVPVVWPRDLNATSLSRPGGYNRAIEIPMFRDTYNKMSAELDPKKLEGLVQEMYDWNREWMVWVGVYQAPSAALYDPASVSSWKMAPEGKGVLGMINNIEYIELK